MGARAAKRIEQRATDADIQDELERYAAELPDPGVLDAYEAVVPGARLRLLRMRAKAGNWEEIAATLRSIIGG